MIHAESTIVFPFTRCAALCVLQSRAHEMWARSFGSSMKDDLRYTPSDCFETFPIARSMGGQLRPEGGQEHYHDFRGDLMVRHGEGLTRSYNRFHDPRENASEIVTPRILHAAMDRAVLDAYGWRDVPTDCEFLRVVSSLEQRRLTDVNDASVGEHGAAVSGSCSYSMVRSSPSTGANESQPRG